MEYTLHPAPAPDAIEQRIVPPSSCNLRQGGGRKDRHGWTEQKRRSNRTRLDSLRQLIKTCVTIWYPVKATLDQLKGFNACMREFCKEKRIPARSVWEGPGRHQHIALGIEHDADIQRAWEARLKKRWLKAFDEPMPTDAFLWKPDIEPEKIASYLSKTRKFGKTVKGAWPWLRFNPVWEVGFRQHSRPSEKQRGKNTSQYSAEKKREIHRQARKTRGYHQSAQTSEKEGEDECSPCPICWTRWGRSLWRRSCICNGSVSLRIHGLPHRMEEHAA
ncbi:MAG: hypothetical protein WAW39_19100 [Prosthecobacter sp.]|uniref:hypothetical protein n=1 Tax=Prosthecobacter sp. TaxID=1965333 RepID=UPI003BB01B76